MAFGRGRHLHPSALDSTDENRAPGGPAAPIYPYIGHISTGSGYMTKSDGYSATWYGRARVSDTYLFCFSVYPSCKIFRLIIAVYFNVSIVELDVLGDSIGTPH